MTTNKNDPVSRAMLREKLERVKQCFFAREKYLDISEPVKKKVIDLMNEGLRAFDAIPPGTSSPEKAIEIAEELLQAIELVVQLLPQKRAKQMNKKQIKARLTSAIEQAETDMPSLLPCLRDLLDDAKDFDDMDEENRNMYSGSVEAWITFIQKSDSNYFEARMLSFRDTVQGKGTARSDKDTALLGYAAMYAIDFASSFCSIASGTQFMSEKSSPEERMEILLNITNMMQGKVKAAQLFLQSLGICSPQDVIVQLEWLLRVVLDNAKSADMKFAICEISDGKLNIRETNNPEDHFCWKKKSHPN